MHARGKPIDDDVELDTVAAGTPGFTGADLANLLNEAALLAARKGEKTIGTLELEEGVMRVIAGPEKRTRLLSEHERKVTAYHEMGHAFVGHFLDDTDPVHKVSIISRGQALGYTISLPTEDRFLQTRAALMDNLAMTLGGRAAEELVFHELTTGAANDLEKVTGTAKKMIMKYGMSEKLGPRTLGHSEDMPFLGRDMGAEPDYSEEIAREIDDEIHRIVEEANDRATTVLRERLDDLHLLSALLIEHETIDRDEFERLLAGESPGQCLCSAAGRGRRRGRSVRACREAGTGARAAALPDPGSALPAATARGSGHMRHQGANVHELARIEMLAGLPGETLARLAERMERQTLAPSERCSVEGDLVAVLNGLAHATDAEGGRETAEPGSVLAEGAVALRAMTPVTIARCPRAAFDELVGSPSDA